MFETNKVKLEEFLKEEYRGSHIAFIGEGWSSITFLIDDNIIRFPKQNIADYEFEAMICGRLKEFISFELPAIEIVLKSKYPHTKHKRLDGKLWNVAHIGNSKSELGTDCALFLYQIHNYSPLTGIRRTPQSDVINACVLKKGLSRYFNRKTVENLCLKYEIATKRITNDNVFIHADFHGDNSVLNCNGRLCGIFDWCNSGIGERASDFIHLYNNFDEQFMNIVFRKYYIYSGITVNKERVKELALVKLINLLYWSKDKSLMAKVQGHMENW